MGQLATRLAATPPALWLESTAYGARLLAKDAPPWLDPAALVAWYGKLLGLLRPELAVLPLEPIVAAWLQREPGLREAMGTKSRAIFPLRTVLADPSLRAHLLEVIRALRAAVRVPLVLSMPSPRAWVGLAYRQAHAAGVEVGDDEADAAAVYLADFLRGFGDSGIDALLLQEQADTAPASGEALVLYQPALNVAAHYQWDLGLQLPGAEGFRGDAAGFAWVIAPQPVPGAIHGQVLPPAFWTRGELPAIAAGTFRYAEIPADAPPEQVLERLAALR